MTDHPPAPATPSGGLLLDAKRELDTAAAKDGVLCRSCRGVISGTAFEFISWKPVHDAGKPTVLRERIFLCDRDECAEARAKARGEASACRSVPGGWEIPEGEVPGE